MPFTYVLFVSGLSPLFLPHLFFFFGDRRDFIAPGILIRTSQFSCLVPLRKPSSLCLLTDFSLFLNTRYFAILNSIIPSSRRLKVKRC